MAYKAPFNYIGNKYRIIDTIKQYFPENIDTFVDLFCGGGDVTINTEAHHKVANDINFFVIGILNWIKNHTVEEILDYIHDTIREYNLSKTNREGFLALRNHYNAIPIEERHPMDLYVLVCYGFNYQFRFNSQLQFNNPFGMNRSCFTTTMQNNLVHLHDLIQTTDFLSMDFHDINLDFMDGDDFIYVDPPYLLTCGSYNDGRRGFRGWGQQDDDDLIERLNQLNGRGIRFAMSNVLEHKGEINEHLEHWAVVNGYHVHDIDFNYNNSNYHSHNRDNITREVLITNY